MSDSKSIRQAFRQCVETADLNEPARSIADLVVSESFRRSDFDKVVEKQGLANRPEFKGILLDLVLLFAEKCVEDHALSTAELQELSFLASVFRIDDGDFLEARRGEVEQLLAAQLGRILEDRYVEEKEEILLRDLQRLFGLSYDQFVGLLRPRVEAQIGNLEDKIKLISDREQYAKAEKCIRNLRSVFLVAESEGISFEERSRLT